MNKHLGWHPSESDLFLHLEGELDARASRKIEEHLRECWDCRVCCQELQRGIVNFVEYRRDVQMPAVAPPSLTAAQFRRKVAAAADDAGPSLLSMLLSRLCPHRVALTGAVSVLLVIVLLVTYTVRPPALTAAEVFSYTVQATARPLPDRIVRAQRIQVRQGLRAVEREILHGNAHRAASAEAQWDGLLAGVPVDMRDPLNPAAFQEWHDAQHQPQDSIVEADGLVTLTTTVPSLRAALIVRRADWHTVGKRFDVPGQPTLEIREVAFELRAEPRIATAVAPALARPVRATVPHISPEPRVDLDLAEVRLRELFRQTGADHAEVPSVIQSDGRLRVAAVVETPSRREELAVAFGAVPEIDLNLAIAGERSSAATTRPLLSAPPAYATEPPLAKALWDYLGGMEPANNYLDMLRDAWLRTLTPSGAMARLAERYPEHTANQLSAEARSRLDALALQYRSEITRNLAAYLRQADEPLDAMRRFEGLPDGAPSEKGLACDSWQRTAPELSTSLQTLQTSVRRLFLVDYTETPLQLSAGALLQDASAARSRLRQLLGCLTQP